MRTCHGNNLTAMKEFVILHLNSIGLCIDIIGVSILFFIVIGPSEQVIRIDTEVEKNRIKRLRRKQRLMKLGYFLVVIGFLFQMLSNELH